MMPVNLVTGIVSILILMSCSSKHTDSKQLSRSDSIFIIQTVLKDKSLVDAFGKEPLELVRYRVIKPDYELTFGGEKVKIVPEEAIDQQRLTHNSKHLLASVPMLRMTSPDTVKLSMILYPGNATFLYTLIRKKNQWQIKGYVYGKI